MTDLAQKTYALLKIVPPGRVTTYKELAHGVGTKSYRAIGQFMRNNPFAPEVPCHRVVSSDGRLYGFKGATQGDAMEEKQELLEAEGVEIEAGKVKDFDHRLYRFGAH